MELFLLSLDLVLSVMKDFPYINSYCVVGYVISLTIRGSKEKDEQKPTQPIHTIQLNRIYLWVRSLLESKSALPIGP